MITLIKAAWPKTCFLGALMKPKTMSKRSGSDSSQLRDPESVVSFPSGV